MKTHSNILIIIILVLFSSFVFAQKNIGIKLPYYIDNPTAVQKIPEDTIEVRCEYCLGETFAQIGPICSLPKSNKTKMELFRQYYRQPIDSISSKVPLVYGSIMAILDTNSLEKWDKDSVYCFLLLIWNMGEYFDTNCINYNVDYFPLKFEFEKDSMSFPSPHIDSVYLLVTHDEIGNLLEMIQKPENNEFLFPKGRDKSLRYFIFPQFFTKNTFNITKKYSYSQIKRYYLKNRHRGHKIIEQKSDGTHYYTICD